MKSTEVDECLSTTTTTVLFQKKTNLLQDWINRMRNLHQIILEWLYFQFRSFYVSFSWWCNFLLWSNGYFFLRSKETKDTLIIHSMTNVYGNREHVWLSGSNVPIYEKKNTSFSYFRKCSKIHCVLSLLFQSIVRSSLVRTTLCLLF